MTILSDRLASVIKWVEHKVFNPFVAFVLGSPLHLLLSWRFIVISYEGRKSGRRYSTPVIYRQSDDALVLFSSEEHVAWWKNFRGGHPLRVLYRGEWHDAEGNVVTDEDAVEEHIRWVLAPVPRLTRAVLRRQFPSDGWFHESADGYVLVKVSLKE
ncbi:MAG: nitroreductase/quinone reductase family protein [Halobacteria archaeon]|nr:nitroreductase/quinone reductase family protein [Halobacteria archaeon]